MSEQCIYTGPSWAFSSYPMEGETTNLAREWKISHVDFSRPGQPTVDIVKRLKNLEKKLPVVWVYGEPLGSRYGLYPSDKPDLLKQENWWTLREEINQKCFQMIDSLNLPVLLIGGHSDIINCDYKNITVAYPSWQKWLGEQCNLTAPDVCWGAEIAHDFIHRHPNFYPPKSLVDKMWEVINYWDELQRRNWFFEVHPNKQGNIEFAKFLKPVVDKFLKENKNGQA